MTGNFKEDRLHIFWKFYESHPNGHDQLRGLSGNCRKVPQISELPSKIRQTADGCYWQVSGAVWGPRPQYIINVHISRHKHQPSRWMDQSIPLKNIYNTKNIVRLFSKWYLPDIYRLDTKPRVDNDSIVFYVIIIMYSGFSRDVIGAILDDITKDV